MKSLLIKIARTVLLTLLSMWNIHAKDWRGITPLKSTRTDVERLLGVPKGLNGYEFKEEKAFINYADGLCHANKDCQCLAPADTVLSVYVILENELSFSKLALDNTKYEKYTSPKDPNVATYSNWEEGIIYTVNQSADDVTAIEYLPSAKDCKDAEKRVANQPRA